MSRVVLQKTLADNLRSNEHVIVTTNNMDGDNVTWPKVDRNSDVLTNSSNRIPSSKVVSEISTEVDSLDVDFGVLRQNLTNLQTSAYILSSGLSSITDGATGKLEKLSADIEYLSSGLSALLNHKAVRFIGVSETDPASGIITINGVKYDINTDFDESNNGDIIYYRTSVPNHEINNIPPGQTSHNYQHQDQSEDVEAIRMIYAYIYSNGVIDDYGGTQQTQQVGTGTFKRFGYGFYENLSTLIHDWDVCDDANIQKSKISGLVDDLAELYARDNRMSAVVDSVSTGISNQVKTNTTNIATIMRDYATKAYVDSKDLELSNKISTDYATKTYVNQVRTDFTNADTKIVNNITTTSSALSTRLGSLESKVANNYIANNRVLTAANSYAALTSTTSHPIDAAYAQNLINQRVLSSNVQTTLANLDSTVKVPAMKVLKDLSASLMTEIANAINKTRPALGTLRFVVLSSTSGSTNQNLINSSTFDGWVYPNGDTLTCGTNDFTTLKEYLGYARGATSFRLPSLGNFLEMWPQRASGTVNADTRQAYQVSMPNHTHPLQNVSASATAEGTATIPTGKSAKNGGVAHHGGGSSSGAITGARINVSLSNISITGTTGNPSDSSYNGKEPKPYHRRVPVMMYIGFKQ